MEVSIPVTKFYGKQEIRIGRKDDVVEGVEPFRCQSLLSGPTLTWKVFKKQADALDFMKRSGFGLMTYAFQTGETRLFLVAHPQVFWHYDRQRSGDRRCSYEVIPEGCACKLYLDLEYDRTVNTSKDQHLLLDSFIQLIVYLFFKLFKVQCDRSMILILDSSTAAKFSSHVIFDIPSVCFVDNHSAGNFIKYICQEVTTSVTRGSLTEALSAGPLSLETLQQFFVKDSKGVTKLFCDECVYSKNRHFRLFKSTKKGKNSPLILYEHCKFKNTDEKEIFLASLVTYVNGSETTKVLQYGDAPVRVNLNSSAGERSSTAQVTSSSCYPKVDDFIRSLIKPPGKIYRSVYFSTSNVIVYDITGYRYCANIGREHKSNNVKYIVDLTACQYYQKCHDFDCSHFKSDRIPLPYDLSFSLSDDSDLGMESIDGLGQFTLSQTVDVLDAIEDFATNPNFSQEFTCETESRLKFAKFPSFGLPDESFSEVADMLEC